MTMPTEAARKHYLQKGYHLHPEPIVEPSLLRRALERIPALIEEKYDTGARPWRRYNVGDPHKIQKIDQVHLCDKTFHLLATHPMIGEHVARLTGADLVQLWATQLFLKPPGGGALDVIGWHTDRENWPFWEGEVLTVWLALEDVGPDSGPVLYMEGSHLWPDAEKLGDAYEQDLASLEDRLKALGPPRQWRKVPVLVKAGGVGVHSADILHGSCANESSVPRVGLGINVRTDRARRRTGVEDYGYASYLDHPFISPIIYQRSRGASQSPRGAPAAAASPAPFVPPRSIAREGAFMVPHLREGMSVLDAGCGDGAITTGLAHLVSPGAVTGIDVDAERLAAARAAATRLGLANARFVETDAHALPFEDRAFDAVFCHTLFAELARPEAAVKELFRVCKPGGVIGVREGLGMFEGLPPVTVNGVEQSVSDLLRAISRAAGGVPDIGARLKGLLWSAGFGRITCTTRSDLHTEPVEIAVLQAHVQSMLEGKVAERAVRAGVTDRAAVAEVVESARLWPADPASIGVVCWIEYVAWKPSTAD